MCAGIPHAVGAQAENSARALIERAANDIRTDPELSRRDAEQALAVLARQPDADLEIRAHMLLCDYQSERSEAAAEAEIAAATALLPQAHRAGLRAGVLTCRGAVRETAGDNASARSLYEQAVQVASAAQDSEMLAEALFSRGYLLGLAGEYAAGLADLRRSQTLYEGLKMPRHALTALNAIAIEYNRMGDYSQAKHIYAEALRAQRAAGMQREVAVTLHNLARAHENLHEWAQARQAFTESFEASRQIGYVRGEAYALRGLAAVEVATGDAAEGLRQLDRAAALQGETPDARLRGLIALERGVALHRLQRLAESNAALEEALGVFRSSDALGDLADTYRELAAVHSELGDWRGAYEHEGNYAQVSDKLLGNQLDQRFAALKVEFDTAAKERENAALLRENEASRQALAQDQRVRELQAAVIALTLLLAIVLASLALHQRGRSKRMGVLAMTDELTGVPNRRAVLGRLGALLKTPDGACCSVLIMDIDHFKRINDHHGHPVGDEVLRVVADGVRVAVQEPSFFGRLGGEEFLIALPGTSLERGHEIAEGFRERVMAIDTARWFADRRVITTSIGVTVSLPAGDTPSSVLKRADTALYAAKRAGRNCVRSELAMPGEAAEPAADAAEHPLGSEIAAAHLIDAELSAHSTTKRAS